MTSNLGSEAILTKGFKEAEETVHAMLKEYFRPEFLNRIDDIVVFKALAKDQVEGIARLLLSNLSKRLEKQLKLNITYSDELVSYLAKAGFDPAFGARPLKRLISHRLETELSREIIKGAIAEGDSVAVGIDGEKLTFEKK